LTVRISSLFLVFLLATACASVAVRENGDMPSNDGRDQETAAGYVESVMDFDGYARFDQSGRHFFVYDGRQMTVYERDAVLLKKDIDRAGQLRWTDDGIYYIAYKDYISDHNWMNTGMVKKLDIYTGVTENVLENEYVSYFDTDGDEMLFIDLGSLYYAKRDGVAFNSAKIINGFCIKAFIMDDCLAVYRRTESDRILVTDRDGRILSEAVVGKVKNKWLPDMGFRKEGPGYVSVSSPYGRVRYAVDRKDIRKTDDGMSPEYPDSISSGGLHFRWVKEDDRFSVYCEKEFLIKRTDALPLHFEKAGDAVVLRWSGGTTVIFITTDEDG